MLGRLFVSLVLRGLRARSLRARSLRARGSRLYGARPRFTHASGGHQPAQNGKTFRQFVGACCETNSEVRVTPAKHVARNYQHAVGDRLFNKFVASDS